MIIAVAVIGSKKQSFLWRDQPQKRSKRTTTTTTRRRKRHFENKRTKKKRQKCDVVMFFFVFVLSSAQKVTIWHFRTSVNRFREVIDSLSLSLVRPISLTLSLTRRSATLSQRGALPHTSRSLSLVRRSSSSAAVLKQEKWHLISDVCADQWSRRLTESVQWEILN